MSEKIGTLSDRISNRIVKHFPGSVVSIETKTPIVSFTFDDIPHSAWTKGARILEEKGVRGTFYIAGTFIDDGQDSGLRMITTQGCADLAERGHELACHTYSHRKLSGFSRQELLADLDRSSRTLGAFDKRSTPRNFSVPYGMSSPVVQPLLRRRFLSSRGIMPGVNRGRTDPHNLAAVELRPDEAFMSEADRWLHHAVEHPGWLIFFTHDVSSDPTFYGCHEERLASLVDAAQKLGCKILTVEAAIQELGFPAKTQM